MRAATGWWTARKPTSGVKQEVKQSKPDCVPCVPSPSLLQKSETTDKSNKALQRQGAVHLEESDAARKTSASAAVQASTSTEMDTNEFRRRGKEMVDYIADYLDTISKRRVTPAIEPGYLRHLIPSDPPNKAESWDEIMNDVETSIMPGVTHWQHPRFHAYFPAGNSYPSILGDMLGDAIGCVGFSWAASPACTELETIVLDWMGKMIGLPEDFLAFSEDSKGGGVIQTSASECILVSMLAARAQTIRALKEQHPFVEEGVLLSKLMAYCSKESHSSVEKAATIGFVKLRILDTDDKCSLRGETLRQAMEEDRAMGLIPFFVSTTLGTTSCCSFDNLAEIGPVCKEFGVWLHVDAAYAGNAFICPEFKYLMKGVEYAMSFNTNPNKWMLVNFDCSTMWVKDRFKLTQALVVDPLYLQHSYSDKAIDYRHWGIPLSRRFRSLKLWFVIRNYGVEGLQKYVREHCRLAKKFESLVRKDDRFEVVAQVILGLVCFRLKGSNNINQKLLSTINASGKLHMVPASVNDRYVIRFCVCAQHATDADIAYAWQVIGEVANNVTEYLVEPDNNKKIVEVTNGNVVGDDDEEEVEEEENCAADESLAGRWESLFLGDGSGNVNEDTLESCIRNLMASSGFDLEREENLISTCTPKSLECCGKDGEFADFSPREFLKPAFFKQLSIPEISNLSM